MAKPNVTVFLEFGAHTLVSIYLALSVIDRIIALSPSVAPAASVGDDATAADTISRGPARTGEVSAFDTEKQRRKYDGGRQKGCNGGRYEY